MPRSGIGNQSWSFPPPFRPSPLFRYDFRLSGSTFVTMLTRSWRKTRAGGRARCSTLPSSLFLFLFSLFSPMGRVVVGYASTD